MHNITDVRNSRRMVRIRISVTVCYRASMVMVCIRRRLGVKYPGCNTERCQQQEHTVECTQAQGARTAPTSVSRAAVSPPSATESVRLWQGMTHNDNPDLRRILHRRAVLSYPSMASCMQQE